MQALRYQRISTKTLLGLHDRLTEDQFIFGTNSRLARRLRNMRQELNYRVVIGQAQRIVLPSRLNSCSH